MINVFTYLDLLKHPEKVAEFNSAAETSEDAAINLLDKFEKNAKEDFIERCRKIYEKVEEDGKIEDNFINTINDLSNNNIKEYYPSRDLHLIKWCGTGGDDYYIPLSRLVNYSINEIAQKTRHDPGNFMIVPLKYVKYIEGSKWFLPIEKEFKKHLDHIGTLNNNTHVYDNYFINDIIIGYSSGDCIDFTKIYSSEYYIKIIVKSEE